MEFKHVIMICPGPGVIVIVCYNLARVIGCTCCRSSRCRYCTCCTARTNDRTSLYHHGQGVFLAVERDPLVDPVAVLWFLWCLSGCRLIVDPLLLRCAQPVVFFCCVYHRVPRLCWVPRDAFSLPSSSLILVIIHDRDRTCLLETQASHAVGRA